MSRLLAIVAIGAALALCLACLAPTISLVQGERGTDSYTAPSARAFNKLSFQCKLHWSALYLMVATQPFAIAAEVGTAFLPSGPYVHVEMHDPRAPALPLPLTLSDAPVRLWFERSLLEMKATLARFGPELERGVPNQNPPCPMSGPEP